MNGVYDSCFKILKNVLKEKEMFSISLKKYSSGIKKEEFQNVSSLSGLFLRNYYFITALCIDILKVDDVEAKIYLGLAYVNNAIKKVLDPEETLNYTKNKLSLYQQKLDAERLKKFNSAVTDKRTYLKNLFSGKGKQVGFKYLSARNNIPEWVVTTLVKQYDKDCAIRTLNAMTKMPKQFGAINTLIVKEHDDKFIDGFKVIDGPYLEFNSTSSIRKHPNVRNGNILPIQTAEHLLIKNLPAVQKGNVAIYFEGRNGVYPAFADKYLETNRVSILSPVQKDNPELFGRVKGQRPSNLDIYLSTRGEIITHLSNPQDLVLFMPNSSNLELLRRIPEYGLLFDTNNLDEIIKNELEGLDDVSQYVNEHGYLVYAVPTFNIKETIVLIQNFLRVNNKFTLINDKVFFPYEAENSVYYYAILQRK